MQFIKPWVRGVLIFLLVLSQNSVQGLADSPSASSEPSYCDPTSFDEKELKLGDGLALEKQGLNRIHAFKLGKVTLVGVGVGNSKVSALKELEKKYASLKSSSTSSSPKQAKTDSKSDSKYCTFYLNHPKGDPKDKKDGMRLEAVSAFNYKNVSKNPMNMTEDEAPKEFMNVLEKTFDQEPTNFLSCAAEENYVALGCNGMMHRGPTVFGMLLAFSGCTPEHAVEIANQTWGLNGVKRKVRLAVIKKAYELGNARKESRKKLADLFSSP